MAWVANSEAWFGLTGPLQDSSERGASHTEARQKDKEGSLAAALSTKWPSFEDPQLIGVLSDVAGLAGSARMTPVWSVKKYRRPVVPGLTGLAVMT